MGTLPPLSKHLSAKLPYFEEPPPSGIGANSELADNLMQACVIQTSACGGGDGGGSGRDGETLLSRADDTGRHWIARGFRVCSLFVSPFPKPYFLARSQA